MTESLARLAPKTQSLEGMPPGGIPAFSGAELAAVLCGLPRGPYLLGRAAYVGDETVIPELQRIVLAKASGIFKREDVKHPGFIRELCAAAIWDVCKPPRCPRCKGTKDAPTAAGTPRACPLCEGLGLVHMGTKRACTTFHIGRERWKSIRFRYHRLEGLLWAWDEQVRGRVRRRMKLY